MSDDVHNPFGEKEKPKKRRQPGIFDPDYKGDNSDPFKSPPDDSKWDEPDESPSTRDV